MKRRVILIVFDGFGLNPNRAYNGWALASTPHLDYYFATNPHTVIQASGVFVGLPDGVFGNSEVGHLTLGSGRVLKQDMLRISEAIKTGEFEKILEWQDFINNVSGVHIVGMVSDGGVHSDIRHLTGILRLLSDRDVDVWIHMITDGRDRPPQSGICYAEYLERAVLEIGKGKIATVGGRYYAMDRVGNFDRTEKAWRAIALGEGPTEESAVQAIRASYDRGETDEFIKPTVIDGYRGRGVKPDEGVLFINFRADRMRQIVAAFGLSGFNGFDRHGFGTRRVLCMTEYDETFGLPVLFKPVIPGNVLAEVLSSNGFKQFHCAEKEKYAHVTYFFNGGREETFRGEDRKIIPSPDVETYDLKPEMSAPHVADEVIKAIDRGEYDFILVNFANGDMVGHTAVPEAIVKAVETLDLQSHRVIQEALKREYVVILTSDHGNCDEMVDPYTGEPHTQHTSYPVPFLVLGLGNVQLGIGRGLADVAPTVLDIMGMEKPPEMSGESIIVRGNIC